MKRLLCTLIAALILFPALANAADSTPRIDKRQYNQRERIHHGIRNGSLTGRETVRLVRGQYHVQRLENRALHDGTVSKRERLRIEGAQNRQSVRIFRQKHDRQRRW